ncbi:MAG: iron-containing alcohol dehydrogenase [Kiritimatiellae bacterium]|nr:iron-containing alcohol dehydrogenase [Kiritimatiellia bacterium]
MSRLEEALKSACDTQACVIGEDVLGQVPALVRRHFPSATRALVVADPRTWAAAGEKAGALLAAAGIPAERYMLEPDGKTFHADYHYAVEVREALAAAGAEKGDLVPVAAGSGVVNDLVKLASGDLKVPYLVCATAASVDGYSSFGAAIRSPEGAKKTYACPAPRAIVADLDVMRTAPKWMAASGFADLLAKVPAGADWILACELGACEWHDRAWHTVQDGLPDALANPEGVAAMETEPMRKFVEGLMLGGFAMQDMQSSRPASGAEHMFSHILEMRDHTYKGDIVPHGIQVGVYTHFMTRFFEQILAFDYTKLDVDACVAAWPDWPAEEALARKLFAGTKFPDVGVTSTKAKYLDKDGLRAQLTVAKTRWPEIKARLENQLLPSAEVERRLRVVGAPVYPEEIGTTREDSRANVIVAAHMRDRYNALDFTYRTGQMDAFARKAFGL